MAVPVEGTPRLSRPPDSPPSSVPTLLAPGSHSTGPYRSGSFKPCSKGYSAKQEFGSSERAALWDEHSPLGWIVLSILMPIHLPCPLQDILHQSISSRQSLLGKVIFPSFIYFTNICGAPTSMQEILSNEHTIQGNCQKAVTSKPLTLDFYSGSL